jgi:putative transposase
VLIFSEWQLYRVIAAYVAYFNQSRPHQGISQRVPCSTLGAAEAAAGRGKVISFPVLNGLHHVYRRAA